MAIPGRELHFTGDATHKLMMGHISGLESEEGCELKI